MLHCEAKQLPCLFDVDLRYNGVNISSFYTSIWLLSSKNIQRNNEFKAIARKWILAGK